MEANTLMTNALFDNGIETSKCTTNNEQHVGRIDLNELLMWVLSSTLWRNSSNGAFKNLQQRLLHTLTRDVTRN